MNINPVSNLQTLRRLPGEISEDARAVTEALQRLPAIHDLLAAVLLLLEPVSAAVINLDQIVSAQRETVARIERTTADLEQRMGRMELALVGLQADVNTAISLLPDPDDDRGALEKAKDAITGS